MIRSLREVEQAMKDYFTGFEVDTKVVPVTFINPPSESKSQDTLAIVLSQQGDYTDTFRWENKTVVLSESIVGGKLVRELNQPEPISVYYIVRLHSMGSKAHSNMIKLKDFVRSRLRRGATITISGQPYPLTQISYKNPTATQKDFGTADANEDREFIEQYLVKVETYLIHADDTKTVPTVDKNIIRVQVKE